MALVATIAIVSLVAILGVATLSLTTRLRQGSSLSIRDARLSAGAAYGLGSVIDEWVPRSLGELTRGATTEFGLGVPGLPITLRVFVTRLDDEVFWVVSEATTNDGAVRRENLIVRLSLPHADSLLAADSADVSLLGHLVVDSLAAHADTRLPGGTAWSVADGITHAAGDLTVTGGSGRGVLIVDGRLSIVGAFRFTGVIVVRGGMETYASGTAVAGLLRAAGELRLPFSVAYERSADTAKAVMASVVRPRQVAGRRWAEMF
ncbi:MAG TPA: hypothetical protein VFO55_04455 [Gemmatimonadaceae bacterium]|nr:hypothetical protein [Gemmatimonadaceae bacterium]